MLRRRIVTAEEHDVHTGWRKYLCYCIRPGVTKAVKRRTNRRERREGKLDIAAQLREDS